MVVTKSNGNAVPSFISYTGTLMFTVYSESISDIGTFSILVTATSGGSTATLEFDVIVTADGWNYYSPSFLTDPVDQTVEVGSLSFYSTPTVVDKDDDTVLMTVTNLDDLPYFIDYNSDFTMFTFAPVLQSEIGSYKIKITLDDQNDFPSRKTNSYYFYLHVITNTTTSTYAQPNTNPLSSSSSSSISDSTSSNNDTSDNTTTSTSTEDTNNLDGDS